MKAVQAVLYLRVSTQEQAIHGHSLPAQEERLRAYCTMAGLEVAAVIREEGVSGSSVLSTRPGGKELLSLLDGGVQHVVALKLDRLFRDAVDCLTQTKAWDKAGIALHLVDMGGTTINTGSTMGRMFLTMAAGFAELERNLISERTKMALSHLKANGITLGAPALTDAATIARIVALRDTGSTLRDIASTMNAENWPTLKGGRWASEQVRRILHRADVAA